MPAHRFVPGDAVRAAPTPIRCVARPLDRGDVLRLLADVGPLLLEASRGADGELARSCCALREIRDRIDRALARCP